MVIEICKCFRTEKSETFQTKMAELTKLFESQNGTNSDKKVTNNITLLLLIGIIVVRKFCFEIVYLFVVLRRLFHEQIPLQTKAAKRNTFKKQ